MGNEFSINLDFLFPLPELKPGDDVRLPAKENPAKKPDQPDNFVQITSEERKALEIARAGKQKTASSEWVYFTNEEYGEAATFKGLAKSLSYDEGRAVLGLLGVGLPGCEAKGGDLYGTPVPDLGTVPDAKKDDQSRPNVEPDLATKPAPDLGAGDMKKPEEGDMAKPAPDMSEPGDMLQQPDLVPQKPIEIPQAKTTTLNNFGYKDNKIAYGDVDGDGKLDLVIGSGGEVQTTLDEGVFRIISDFNNKLPNNQTTNIKNVADATIWGEGKGYVLGVSNYVADVTNDGKADVFVGSGYKAVGAVFRYNGRPLKDQLDQQGEKIVGSGWESAPTGKQASLALDNNQNAQGVSILVGSANDVGGLGYDIKPVDGTPILFVGAGNFIRIVPDANFQGKVTVDQVRAPDIWDSVAKSTDVYAPVDANNFVTAQSLAFKGSGEVQVVNVTKQPMPAELNLGWELPPDGITIRRLKGSQDSQAGHSMVSKGGLVFVGVPTHNSPANNGAVTILANMPPQQDDMLDNMARTRIIGPKGSGFGTHNDAYEKNGKVVECALAPDNNDAALYIFEDAAKLPAGDVNAEDVATKIYRDANIKGACNLTCVDGFASYETLGGDVVVVRTQ